MASITQKTASPFVLAVTGGSGSGKSHLAATIANQLGDSCHHLKLDDFYRDCSHLPEAERNNKNYDVPSAIDWASFFNTIGLLQDGKPAHAPQYDLQQHARRPDYQRFLPQTTLIVEGLWVLHCKHLRQIYHHRIYVDCPTEIRLKRRLERDAANRGRNPEGIVRQFNQHTQPMEQKWVLPQKQFADTVIQSPFESEQVSQLIHQLRLS